MQTNHPIGMERARLHLFIIILKNGTNNSQTMEKKLISESEIKRISQLSKSMMMQESQSWRPSQWAAYLSKGNTFDDTELDKYIEEEIIER